MTQIDPLCLIALERFETSNSQKQLIHPSLPTIFLLELIGLGTCENIAVKIMLKFLIQTNESHSESSFHLFLHFSVVFSFVYRNCIL